MVYCADGKRQPLAFSVSVQVTCLCRGSSLCKAPVSVAEIILSSVALV